MSSNSSTTNSSPYQYIFKIILIGDSSTGKTSLIHRFVNRTFDDKYLCTIGVDFFMKTLDIKDNIVKLQLWDTAGMEKYKSISSSYYRGAHAAFIVFDVSCRVTFQSVTKWIEAFYKNSNQLYRKNVLLIGNKTDLVEEREVNREEAENFAESNGMLYWETSAKEGRNVDEVFNYMGEFLFDNFRGSIEQIRETRENKSNRNFTNLFPDNEKKNWCC